MLDNVYYFVDDRGHKPVKEFIDSLPIKEQAKVFAYIAELKERGRQLRRPAADYLRDGIYELRPRDNRVFYFFFMKNNVVLLHAIKKKTDKITGGDLALCLKRKQNVEEAERIEKL